MRRLYVIGVVGLLLSIATAFLYVRLAETSSLSTTAFVVGETFKALLTFTLVALGGALIKEVVDASLDEQRALRSLAEQTKERRFAIITEFVGIFSQFYSVRKLYESAQSHPQSYDQGSEEYALLLKDLLKKSVELEGRYGALKLLAINHFGLCDSNLGTKTVAALETSLKGDPRSIRIRLDLLGELYDDWRHALESRRAISEAPKVWKNYEELLKFLMEAGPPTDRGTNARRPPSSIEPITRIDPPGLSSQNN